MSSDHKNVPNDNHYVFQRKQNMQEILSLSNELYGNGNAQNQIVGMQNENENQQNQSLPFNKILPIMLTLCLSGLYFGHVVVYSGAVKIQQVIEYYKITMSQSLAIGILNGMGSIGGGLGCLLTSIFLEKFSRKNSLLITGYMALASGCIIFVPNQVILIIMRLIQGICLGLYTSIVPLYIRQISPLHLAGTFGALLYFFMALGTVFCFLLSYLLKIITEDIGIETSWEGMFAFPLLPLITQLLLINLKYPFETPKYLILNNREAQLPKLLENFYHKESIEVVMQRLKNNILNGTEKQQPNGKIKQSHIQQKLSVDINQQVQQNLISGQNRLRKTPTMAFVSGCFMSFSQQMVGMGCVVVYGSQLVSQRLPQLSNQSGIIINIPLLVSSLFLSYLLSKYNRKSILQCGMIALALIDIMIGMAFLNSDNEENSCNHSKNISLGYVILAGQFLYNAVYAISVGSLLWIFLPALMQPNLIPVATFMNWVSSAIVLIVFPLIKDELPNQNPGWLFIFFAVYTFFCFVIYAKIVIEIKDKTQKQIFQEYDNMKLCQ